jgi:nucleotide-binding universal stress UspA family protein
MLPPIVTGAHPKRDDSAPLELGVMLSRLTGAPLHVVGTFWFDSTPQRTAAADHADSLKRGIRQVVERAIGDAPLDVPAEVHVSPGSPAHALREAAEELSAGTIVVGSTHRGKLGRIATGTTAGRVLDGAPCPVIIAPRAFSCGRTSTEKVGVAFVDTPGGRSALSAGAAIARRSGSRLIAYTVTDADTHADDRRRAEAAVERALAEAADGVDCEARVLRGGVEALIFETRELDFLLRGCRSEGRLLRPLAREVPNQLASDAACPVVVVPPGREHRFLSLFGAGDSAGREAALLA